MLRLPLIACLAASVPATFTGRGPDGPAVETGSPETLLRRVTAQADLALGVHEGMPPRLAGVEGLELLEEVCRRASDHLPPPTAYADADEHIDPSVAGELFDVLGRLLDEVDAVGHAQPSRRAAVARSEVEVARRVRAVAESLARNGHAGAEADLLEWRLRFLESALQLRSSGTGATAAVLALKPVEELAYEVEHCARSLASLPDGTRRLSRIADDLLETDWIETSTSAAVGRPRPEDVRDHAARRRKILERVILGGPGIRGFESASEGLARAARHVVDRVGSDHSAAAAELYEIYELGALVWGVGRKLGEEGTDTEATVRQTWMQVFADWKPCTVTVDAAEAFRVDRTHGDLSFNKLDGPLKLAEEGLKPGPVGPRELSVEVIGDGGAVYALRNAEELGLEHFALPAEMDYRLGVRGRPPVILAHMSPGRPLDVRVPARIPAGYTLFVNLPEDSGVEGPMGLISPPWSEHFLASQIQDSVGQKPFPENVPHPLRDLLVDLLEVPAADLVNFKEREEAIRARENLTADARVAAPDARELQRQFMLRGKPVDAFPTPPLIGWLRPIAEDVLEWPDLRGGCELLTNQTLGDELRAADYSLRNVLWIAPRKE